VQKWGAYMGNGRKCKVGIGGGGKNALKNGCLFENASKLTFLCLIMDTERIKKKRTDL
jgi:hypothetical protein